MIIFKALSEKHVCVVFAGLLLLPVVQSLFPGGQRVRRCRGNKQTLRDFNAEGVGVLEDFMGLEKSRKRAPTWTLDEAEHPLSSRFLFS